MPSKIAFSTALNAQLLARIRAQASAGKADLAESEAHIPVANYFSAERWQAEKADLFEKLPLIAAHSSEIAPGQVLAHDAYGTPLLLMRDTLAQGGQLRCFLNVCRHRGMRLVEQTGAHDKASVVCPYHGWTYKLDGALRHMLHAESFAPCAEGERDLVALPCAERHGLVWVMLRPDGLLDLDAWLGPMNEELAYFDLPSHVVHRTVEAEYDANWKLIVDAFLEAYHIRVLHKNTIYPFFTDGITAAEYVGGSAARAGSFGGLQHSHSLVARRPALEPFEDPESHEALRKLTTPSQVIFPNTITIFHPDYLSLVTLYPVGPERLRWTHRMVIPKEKSGPEWAAHWDKTFNLIEKGVFQAEDIHTAVQTQRGMKTAANSHLTAGRMESGLGWFHGQIDRALHLQKKETA